MTDLPHGWTQVKLGDVALSVKNGIFVSRPGAEPDGVPILRISAVRSGSLQLEDVRYTGMDRDSLAQSDALLTSGDLLFTRYNGNIDFVGACAVVPDTAGILTYPDKLIRVRVDVTIADPSYIGYAFESPQVRSFVRAVARTTAGQAGISGSSLKSVPILLPPLVEQRRIVTAIEEVMSRLVAGKDSAIAAEVRTALLRRAHLRHLRDRAVATGGTIAQVGEVADTSLGKMLDFAKNQGDPTPYLRNINVRWGRIDMTQIATVPLSSDERRRFNLCPGDLLVCEGGEPGRCAVWDGSVADMAYQKALHRVRVKSGVESRWLALALEEAVRNGRTAQLETGSTIKHLPQEKLRQVEVVIPDNQVQRNLIEEFEFIESGISMAAKACREVQSRSEVLKQVLLEEAFAGRLVPQDPKGEPVLELLARIQAQKTAALPKQKTRSRRTQKELAAPPTRVTGDDYQQEALPL
ncbi:hypothetical protein [Micromonospora sp. NPDC005172]|uniref:restriction endonuclease subunit S n=1 Tax=Micromonospora sp. NPDC005172 TaxID=3156867 RepID=UPI0033B7F7B3